MTIATVPTVSDPRELALLKAVGLDRLSSEQRELALNIAGRYDLDLMLKHLVMIEGRPYVTRDGLLHVAHRSGQLDGIETTDPVLSDGFWRASCSVYRKDMGRPFTYSGRYPENGTNKRFAPEMAVKVAEVMALRRAFDVAAPTAEERWDLEQPVDVAPPKPVTLAERVAEKVAAVKTDEEADEATWEALKEAVTAGDQDEGGLSVEAFASLVRDAELLPEKVRTKSGELFPGRGGVKNLTDIERGRLAHELGLVP